MTVPTETETDTARPAAPTQHLTYALTTLHLARAYAAAADAEVADLRRQWDAAHEERLDDQAAARESLKRAETLVRDLVLAYYRVTRVTKPVAGVEVITRREAVISNETDARQWAEQSGVGLVLDRRAIERAALTMPIPGTTAIEVHATRIASDLGKALGLDGAS